MESDNSVPVFANGVSHKNGDQENIISGDGGFVLGEMNGTPACDYEITGPNNNPKIEVKGASNNSFSEVVRVRKTACAESNGMTKSKERGMKEADQSKDPKLKRVQVWPKLRSLLAPKLLRQHL